MKQKTAQGRLRRALRKIAQWCRQHRHDSISEQHRTLSQKLRGHYGYYGITGNGMAIQRFRNLVVRIWKKWLARRRRRGFLSWAEYGGLLKQYVFPPAIVVHSVYRRAREPAT